MDANASGKTRKDWLSFDRADYLATTMILGVAAIGSVLFGLGGPILAAVNNTPLPVSYTSKITSGLELPRGATHDGVATVELLLNDAAPGERLVQALPELMVAGLTIAVAWMLYHAIQTTGRLPDRGGLAFVFTFTPLPLVVMLVIALIGEVFRRGVQLRDDVEGLV